MSAALKLREASVNEVIGAIEALYADAKRHVLSLVKVAAGPSPVEKKIDAALLDRHQLAAHALAYIATELEASKQLVAWAERAGGEYEQSIARAYVGDFARMLRSGVDLGALENVGISELGVDPAKSVGAPAIAAFADEHASGDSYLRIAKEARQRNVDSRGGAHGLDETLAQIQTEFRRFVVSEVEPIAQRVHQQDVLIPIELLRKMAEMGVKFTIQGDIWLAADIERGPSGSRLRIRVRDSGIGIPQDKLCVIFQAFRQLDAGLARSYSGLGLGLALSDKLVRLMGGDITVDSEVGRGTTFTIRLPLTVPLQHPPTGTADQDAGRRRPLVLVVEDNLIAQRVVGHILERTDCEVVFAHDGESGIRVVCAQPVDLILMDLQMPGMDGFAASKAIRKLPGGGDIPILALTANYSDEHRALCHQIGMQGFLSKPIQSEELLGAINAWLRAPRYEL